MNQSESDNLCDKEMDQIQRLVKGRRYCCVIMPYRSLGLLYQRIRDVIQQSTGLACIRADDVPGSGQSLLDKIHKLIEGAEVVLAELSEPSPNVYYEVGYAAAKNSKNILIVCHESTTLPTDLMGLERITYVDTPQDLPRFEAGLRQQLSVMLDSDRELLRAMLVAPDPSPAYLLANPRGATRKDSETKFLERFTHGDNLGVLGVLSALGAVLDKDERPHLITAKTADPGLIDEDNNLYLIGSPRTTKMTEKAMRLLQEGEPEKDRRWRFPDPNDERQGTLTGWTRLGPFKWTVSREDPVPDEDWGLILRGPRPNEPKRRLWVFAGARSFGTGGACLAATTPRCIRDIANRLRAVDLGCCDKTIWAIVHVRPDKRDHGRVTEECIGIDDVGVMGD